MTSDRPIILTIPNPPSLNKLWARKGGGGRTKSREYRAWLTAAGWEVRRQAVGMVPLACRYDMTINVPISRRDTGNWEKPIGDLLQAVGVVTNDGNIHALIVCPMARNDCMVALTPLPDMGGVRKPARSAYEGRTIAAKPTRKAMDKMAALRQRVPF